MSINMFGKPTETVDFGGEVDYNSYEWFKDPPPRAEVTSFLDIFLRITDSYVCRLPHHFPLRPKPTYPLRTSSRGTRSVILPSRRRPMCCTDDTNSTDRCVSSSISQKKNLFPSSLTPSCALPM